ncbi:hypothetical protein WJX72_004243 [[Myrmecia] bisecta]|uniref:Uncharacterized protein n=1 Tax=[Myrmecia] bisecta TaxID=41462 RepID=A0AAW1P4Q6_9CHLO
MASEVFIRQCHIDSDCQAGLQSLWCPTRIFSRAGGYALPAAALEQEELDARRIIESDAAIPPLDLSDNWPYTPAETRWILEKLSPEGLSLLRYNQTKKDRICPYCKTRFWPLPEGQVCTAAEGEQTLSGICSSRCFRGMNGPVAPALEHTFGQEADETYCRTDRENRDRIAFVSLHPVGGQR